MNQKTGRNSRSPEECIEEDDMAGMLDELFEDLIKEPEQKDEKPDENKEHKEAPETGDENESNEAESPLFPTGNQWEDFKKGHKFGP